MKLNIPFLASSMDGVVDVKMAVSFNKLDGLGISNKRRTFKTGYYDKVW